MTLDVAWPKLAEPFPASDVEWRIGSSGKKASGEPWAQVLCYLTARAVMDRLDAVVGPQNWSTSYVTILDAARAPMGIECRLSLFGVVKADVGTVSDIEPLKGAYSDALKRAAVQWGIGRYLYDLGVSWANISPQGKHSAKGKDGAYFKWDPPMLPSWAVGKGAK